MINLAYIILLAGPYGMGGSWTSVDKAAHFFGGYMLTDMLQDQTHLNRWQALALTFGASLGKELVDSRDDGASVKDLVAGMAGAGLRFGLSFRKNNENQNRAYRAQVEQVSPRVSGHHNNNGAGGRDSRDDSLLNDELVE